MSQAIDFAAFEERVRCRAYALWENEGRPFGRDAEHWRASEQATLAELTAAAPVAKPKAAARKRAPKRLSPTVGMSTSH